MKLRVWIAEVVFGWFAWWRESVVTAAKVAKAAEKPQAAVAASAREPRSD